MCSILSTIQNIFRPYHPPSVEGFTFKHPYPQRFPFCIGIMRYITMNPTEPKVWKKLIRTCKYFYSQNSVTLVHYLFSGILSSHAVDEKFRAVKILDVKKLWSIYKLVIFHDDPINEIKTKIYRSDFLIVHFTSANDILLNDVVGLTSKKLQILRCDRGVIFRNLNGEIVKVEEIVKTFPQIYVFDYAINPANITSITSETAKKLVEILPSTNIIFLNFKSIPEQFDFQAVFDFVVTQKPKIRFSLTFGLGLSMNYKSRLEAALKEILRTNQLIFPHLNVCYIENRIFEDDKLAKLHKSRLRKLIYFSKYQSFVKSLKKKGCIRECYEKIKL